MRRPMRTVVAALLSAALGVSSAFLVACGDRNSLIPADDAAAMRSDLDMASSLYAREECRAAQRAVRSARSRAERLPRDVDADLRATLEDNLDTALARIVSRCGRTTTTQTTETATTATQTTEAPPTVTTTEPPTETTTTQAPPTTEEIEPPADPAPGGGTPPEEFGE